MRRDGRTSSFSEHLLSPEVVAAYDPEGDFECCDATDFRVDIRSSATSPWNKSCARTFEKSFLNVYPQFHNRGKIPKSWVTHLTTLKRTYKQQEEFDDTRDMGLRRKRREDRKLKVRLPLWPWGSMSLISPQLYQRRWAIAQALQNEHHIPILDVILKLDVDGISSDESDHEVGHGEATYFILCKHWRSQEVTEALRTLDALHLATRYKGQYQATSGSWPHFRTYHATLRSRRPPVRHLPLNFYDPEWYLNCREDSPLDYQDILPSSVSRIAIPPYIVRQVKCFSPSRKVF